MKSGYGCWCWLRGGVGEQFPQRRKMIRVIHLLNNSRQDQYMNSLKAKNKVHKVRQQKTYFIILVCETNHLQGLMKLKQRKTLSPLGIIKSRDMWKRRELFINIINLGLRLCESAAMVVNKTIQILDYFGYISLLKTNFRYNVFISIWVWVLFLLLLLNNLWVRIFYIASLCCIKSRNRCP